MKINQAVILAGGIGKRLEPITTSTPKPLVKVSGKPFIINILNQLKNFYFKKIIILTGYKSKMFKQIISKYKFHNFKIKIIEQPTDYDTGARLISAKNYLDKNFMLLYGDNYCGLDLNKIIFNFMSSKSLFQLVAYFDWNNFSKANIEIYRNNKIKIYDRNRRNKNLSYVDIGYICINKKIIENIKFSKNLSLSKDIISNLVKKKIATAYKTFNLYCTVGNMQRLMKAQIMFANRKFIFLDRDGVLNIKPKKGEYVRNINEIKWKEGSLEALKYLKKNGYQTIIVTNQAGIGRGLVEAKHIRNINSKMSDDARNYGGS